MTRFRFSLRRLLLLAPFCLAACASPSNSRPATQPALRQPVPAPVPNYEWRPIFDGRSLRNWKPSPFPGGVALRLNERAMILSAGATLSGATYTASTPTTNYEIEVLAQRVDGHDFFCGLTFPVADSSASLIVGGWGGSVCGISCIDYYDASSNSTTTEHAFESGRWYTIRMLVTTARLQAWIDDKQILNTDIRGKTITIRNDIAGSLPFGLATYQTSAAIARVRLRDLRPDEIEAVESELP